MVGYLLFFHAVDAGLICPAFTFFSPIMKRLVFFLYILTLFSCETNASLQDEESRLSVSLNWRELSIDSAFSLAYSSEPIQPLIEEISGICPSHCIDSAYWVHEDSGTAPKLYLYHIRGHKLATVNLKGIGARDFEDISSTYNQVVYIADIGDNNEVRPDIKIYQFNDPFSLTVKDTTLTDIKLFTVNYPDAYGAQDAEAFSVDPLTGDFYIFTKAVGHSNIFRLPYETQDTQVVLEYVGNLSMSHEKITASDFSTDGCHFLLKSYEYIYEWERGDAISFSEVIKNTPKVLPYKVEAQGEAACWSLNANAYITISEYSNSIHPVFRFYSNSITEN